MSLKAAAYRNATFSFSAIMGLAEAPLRPESGHKIALNGQTGLLTNDIVFRVLMRGDNKRAVIKGAALGVFGDLFRSVAVVTAAGVAY
ncbi:hypothetical protein [Martelella sp. FOR1707]